MIGLGGPMVGFARRKPRASYAGTCVGGQAPSAAGAQAGDYAISLRQAAIDGTWASAGLGLYGKRLSAADVSAILPNSLPARFYFYRNAASIGGGIGTTSDGDQAGFTPSIRQGGLYWYTAAPIGGDAVVRCYADAGSMTSRISSFDLGNGYIVNFGDRLEPTFPRYAGAAFNVVFYAGGTGVPRAGVGQLLS